MTSNPVLWQTVVPPYCFRNSHLTSSGHNNRRRPDTTWKVGLFHSFSGPSRPHVQSLLGRVVGADQKKSERVCVHGFVTQSVPGLSLPSPRPGDSFESLVNSEVEGSQICGRRHRGDGVSTVRSRLTASGMGLLECFPLRPWTTPVLWKISVSPFVPISSQTTTPITGTVRQESCVWTPPVTSDSRQSSVGLETE